MWTSHKTLTVCAGAVLLDEAVRIAMMSSSSIRITKLAGLAPSSGSTGAALSMIENAAARLDRIGLEKIVSSTLE